MPKTSDCGVGGSVDKATILDSVAREKSAKFLKQSAF